MFSKKKSLFITFIVVSCIFQSMYAASSREKLIEYSKKYLGTPYVYAGTTSKGMDCSGFVSTVVKESLGITLSRSSKGIYQEVPRIKDSEIQAGDLLFFTANTDYVCHVAIYIGDRQMIHSASAGKKTGVIISSIDEKYWRQNYVSAGRFLPAEETSSSKEVQKEKASSDKEKVSLKEPSANEVIDKKAAAFLSSCKKYIDVPYRKNGFSKDGLTNVNFVRLATMDAFEIPLGRSANGIYQQTRKVQLKQIQPGDLVFFKNGSAIINYVGVYLGNDEFIHCDESKNGKVKISSLKDSVWKKNLFAAGRLKY